MLILYAPGLLNSFFFKYLIIYLFYFWLRQVLVAARGVFVEAYRIFRWSRVFIVALGLLSSCGAGGPGRVGSVVCGTQALSLRHTSSVVVARGLSCPAACGILVPWPGIKPTSPALEGRFFTTGPPGKSLCSLLYRSICVFVSSSSLNICPQGLSFHPQTAH